MKALFLVLLLVRALDLLARSVWWLVDGGAHPVRAGVVLGGLFFAFAGTAVVVARSARARAAIVRLRDRRRVRDVHGPT